MNKPSSYLRRIKATEAAPLLEFVLRAWPDVKRTQAKLWLRHRSLMVNGEGTSHFDTPVKPGDWVAVRAGKFAAPDTQLPSSGGKGLRIRHEDASIIVIEKPPGLLSIATDKGEEQTAYFKLTSFLRNRGKNERVFIVHRLDRDTSGLLVFAKTPEAKRKLQEGWDRVEKRYTAVVEGTPQPPQGTLRANFNESGPKVFVDVASRENRLGITHYKTVRAGTAYTVIEAVLETGRRNQIRVHFAHAGHPVAGDEKYGAKTDPLRRLALHASVLRFPHPVTGESMEFRCPAPGGFATAPDLKQPSRPLPPPRQRRDEEDEDHDFIEREEIAPRKAVQRPFRPGQGKLPARPAPPKGPKDFKGQGQGPRPKGPKSSPGKSRRPAR